MQLTAAQSVFLAMIGLIVLWIGGLILKSILRQWIYEVCDDWFDKRAHQRLLHSVAKDTNRLEFRLERLAAEKEGLETRIDEFCRLVISGVDDRRDMTKAHLCLVEAVTKRLEELNVSRVLPNSEGNCGISQGGESNCSGGFPDVRHA